MFTTLKNWWGGLFNNNRLAKNSTAEPFLGSTTASGGSINADTALKLSAVWACVRLRSQTISSLPLHLYGQDKKTANDHPLYRILHDSPNADMTASEFWESVVASLDLWGNAFIFIGRHNGVIKSLEPLMPDNVQIIRDKNGVITYRYTENNQIFYYTDNEILHIKGFTLDGRVGLSPIQYQAQVMGYQIDANNAANHEFKNSLKVGGFLKTGEKTLTDQQREMLRGRLTEFGKPENSGKFMILEAGMDLAGGGGIRMNPQDAQLLESRYFGIEEICRAFGVPPQLIYHTDKASSWASSLENMNLGFLMYSLRPILVRIEQAIVKKLLSSSERGKYKPRFSVEGLLRADTQGRTSFYTSALQNGWLTRNEVRELEDLPPIDGGNDLTVQLNLTPLQFLGKDNTGGDI